MQFVEENLNTMTLVGISVRTNNEKAQSQSDIAKLWDDFFVNNILNKIECKISDDIYCVYTEYENDYTADYKTFIGCQVSRVSNFLEGFEKLEIEANKYYKFISEGSLPDCVLSTWKHIWENDYKRAYKADFDIYGIDTKDPQNAIVTTYLSIK